MNQKSENETDKSMYIDDVRLFKKNTDDDDDEENSSSID